MIASNDYKSIWLKNDLMFKFLKSELTSYKTTQKGQFLGYSVQYFDRDILRFFRKITRLVESLFSKLVQLTQFYCHDFFKWKN